jgi:hypothetical protein
MMAARLDLYAETDANSSVGFVSANDDDEERLAALLADLAGRSALSADSHGSGHVDAGSVAVVVQELSEMLLEVDDDLERSWVGALHTAAVRIGAAGGPLSWRMRYDVGGSIDDGPDEFPTAWSG